MQVLTALGCCVVDTDDNADDADDAAGADEADVPMSHFNSKLFDDVDAAGAGAISWCMLVTLYC